MIKRKTLFFPVFLLLLSCGIEDYPYIPPVPPSFITRELDNFVTIQIPDASDRPSFFTKYAIFYKIYVSDAEVLRPDKNNFGSINPTLLNDYVYIEPYLSSDNVTTITGTVSTSAIFSTRGFMELEYEGVEKVEDIWSSITSNMKVEILFEEVSGSIPKMNILEMGSGFTPQPPWNILRSGSLDNPLPANRYFLNDRELYDSGNINANTNADVVNLNKENISVYNTYVCLYIAACGLNIQTYTPIYSSPTFLHVMRLPQP